MADWDSLLKESGGALVTGSSPPKTAPVTTPTVSAQPARFAADVGARAAGVFAGWPVDTLTNLANLGIAGYGFLGGKNAEGLPPDLITNPAGGSQQITQGYRNLLALAGNPQAGVAPASKLQEFAGNVGEMAGGAGMGGVPRTVASGARTLASLIGAEAGRNAGEQLAPDSPVAQVLGQFVGGVAVPSMVQGRVSGAKALLNAGKEQLGTASDKALPVAEGIIDKNIKANVMGHPSAAANIDEALRLQQKFPGVNLSVAEMTGAPGLAEMQSKFASLNPKNLNSEIARSDANIAALQKAVQERTPQTPASPNEPRNAINRALAAQEGDLAAKQADLTGSLANQSQRDAGAKLLDIANAERQAAKTGIVQPAYNAAFAAAGKSKIDVSNVLAEAEGILGRKLSDFAPETAPNTVRMLKTFEPKQPPEQKFFGEPVFTPEGPTPKPQATLQQLDDVRKAINADIQQSKTSSAPTSDMTLRNLYKLHGAIDEAVGNSSLPQSAKDAYANALNTYRTQYAPRFKEGVNANLYRQTSLNEPKLNPDNVVKTYFQPSGEREATQFVKMFGKSSDAIQTAKSGIEDLYRQKVVNPTTGEIDPAAHARFMAQYSRPISIMDKAGMGIGDRLSEVGKTANELSGVKQALQEKAQQLKYDTSGDMQSALLQSPMKMGVALREMDQPAKSALARSIMEEAWSPVKNKVPEAGSKMADYLTKNERTVKMAMSAAEGSQVANKHFSDIQDVAKTLQMIEKANVRGRLGQGTGNDPLKSATGVSIPTVWSQTRAVMQGRQGVGTAVAMIAGPALTKLSQVQFDSVMNRALHDPKMAAALRDYLNSNPSQANAKASQLMQVWDATKLMAKKAPGLATKYWIGVPNYPGNLARIAPSLSQQGANAANR